MYDCIHMTHTKCKRRFEAKLEFPKEWEGRGEGGKGVEVKKKKTLP